MAKTFMAHAEKMNNCLSQLRSLQGILEYWKSRQPDDDNEWLLQKADEFIDRAAKRIYTNELMGKKED
jgi:hypothetical protein